MKQLYLFILLTFLVLASKAQLTYSNHAPVAGEKYFMYQCDSTGIDPGPAGANVTWNFALNTHTDIVRSYSVGAVVNDYDYPLANTNLVNNGYDTYHKSTPTRLYYYGGDIKIGPVVYIQIFYGSPALHAIYPMNLNTFLTANTSGTVNMITTSISSGTFTGNSHVIADGTGTLVLPDNTYNNVMRVVQTQTINYKTNIIGTVKLKTYEFYESGIKSPVLSIASSTISTAIMTVTQTLVTRFKHPDNLVSLEDDNLNQTQISLFPNPANQTIYVSAASLNSLTISLSDLSGRVLLKKEIQNNEQAVDVSSLNQGLYIYTLTDRQNKTIKSGKIVIGNN